MGTPLLQALFRQKAAINEEFFAVLETVAAGDRVDAIRVLNHIHVVDRIFAAHLRGEPHGYKATNTPETPTLAALRAAVLETDHWFVEQAGTLAPAQLAETVAFTFTDGQRGRMSREEMLAHVITHGSYHRGEVGQMLKRLSLAPPRDLFTAYLHRAEPQRRELA
ncbi:MAG: DinB family protein [Burkholderiaceae bacterium]